MGLSTDKIERNILRFLFDSVSSLDPIDNSVSDTKIIRDTQNKLKNALRGAKQRCTCAKRTWGGPCEVCQTSDNELVHLRNFYRVIKKAKKHQMTTEEIQEFVENTSNKL
ncbi:MAG: hypothetical protein KDD61_12305 [Bdellovibrionales bacterium]|nr:hypothetical protein [Bdellovibrionales bacterium]